MVHNKANRIKRYTKNTPYKWILPQIIRFHSKEDYSCWSLSLFLSFTLIFFWQHFSSILNMTPLLGCNVSAGGQFLFVSQACKCLIEMQAGLQCHCDSFPKLQSLVPDNNDIQDQRFMTCNLWCPLFPKKKLKISNFFPLIKKVLSLKK